jgi:hypothetical protein
MNKAFIKIPSLLLCGLLIYNSLGHILVLTVMRMAIRHQMWEKLSIIPDQDLTMFVIAKNSPPAGFKIENEHEIIVDGKLYDIVRKTDDGAHVKYFCVYDHNEQTLITRARQFNSQAQQMPLQNLARLMVEKIIKTAVIAAEASSIKEHSVIPFSNFCEAHYSVPWIQIALPPPQSI